MTGEETFEFAAAIAGVSIGLGALLILAIVGIIGVWRLVTRADDAQQAVIRSSVAVEEAARRLETAGPPPGQAAQLGDVEQRIDTLLQEQRRLHEMARGLLDTMALESGDASLEVVELESTVSRLDATVGQMATSLANLIRIMEEREQGK